MKIFQKIKHKPKHALRRRLMPFIFDPPAIFSLTEGDREVVAIFIQNLKRVMRWLRSASFVFASKGVFDILVRSEKCDSRLSLMIESLLSDSLYLSKYRVRRKLSGEVTVQLTMINILLSERSERMVDIFYKLNPEDFNAVRTAIDTVETSIHAIEEDIIKRKVLIGKPGEIFLI